MVYPDQRNSGSVGVGITEKGSWGIAVPKILERARETSPAGRCHHGVAACSDLGPSGVVVKPNTDILVSLKPSENDLRFKAHLRRRPSTVSVPPAVAEAEDKLDIVAGCYVRKF